MDTQAWIEQLQERVRTAVAAGCGLRLEGSGSKAFYGGLRAGEPLDLRPYAGVVAYEPAELAVTARAGTPLAELEALLAQHQQMLAFEPPYFGPGATVGGCVATGLSGPSRPFRASVRDHILGLSCVTGSGDWLRFGGTVIKNVAGFDVSRLMVGALGRLGILIDVTLRTVPRPGASRTLVFQSAPDRLLERLLGLAKESAVTAAAALQDTVYLRISGSERFVATRAQVLGGDLAPEKFWTDLREQQHPFFAGEEPPLWRLSLASAARLDLEGHWLLDWGGAQRWLRSTQDAVEIRTAVARCGGHASLFRGGTPGVPVFQPLAGPLAALERRLRQAFDPHEVLNPGDLRRGANI